jgi:hypothetical protein
MTTVPNGELRRQDFHLQVQQLVSLCSFLWVPLACPVHDELAQYLAICSTGFMGRWEAYLAR